jgi:PAS domain S-box-containing protein
MEIDLLPKRPQAEERATEGPQLSEVELNWLETERQQWEQAARIAQDDTPEQFAQRVVYQMSESLECLQACFFIADEEQRMLYPAGIYAARQDQVHRNSFAFGLGPVGQAHKVARRLEYTSVPEDSIPIKMGLTTLQPGSMVFQPLVFNQRSYAVVEMVLTRPLSKAQQALLDQTGSYVASNLQSLLSTTRTQRLLSELQAREEEMRQNNEELLSTQEEMQRRQEEAYNQQVILEVAQETAEIGTWEIDLFGMSLKISNIGKRLLALPEMDAYQPDDLEYSFNLESRDRFEEAMKRCVDQDESFQMEVETLTEEGAHQKTLVLAGRPLKRGHDEVQKVVGSVLDITEQRESRRQLEESRQNLEAMLDAAPFGMLVTELENGRVVMANTRAADLFGYRVEELIGKKTAQMYAHPQDREHMRQVIEQSGTLDDYRLEMLDREGNPFWISLNTTIIEYNRKPHFFGALLPLNQQ